MCSRRGWQAASGDGRWKAVKLGMRWNVMQEGLKEIRVRYAHVHMQWNVVVEGGGQW